MRILLDTCTFLWIYADAEKLSQHAAQIFDSAETEVFLSPVSIWEIALKYSIGRLHLTEPPWEFVPRLRRAYGLRALPFEDQAALQTARLPDIHKDPFDRILICQAIVHRLAILTPDPQIAQYPVRTIW